MAAMRAEKTLDFSSFPTVLLLAPLIHRMERMVFSVDALAIGLYSVIESVYRRVDMPG